MKFLSSIEASSFMISFSKHSSSLVWKAWVQCHLILITLQIKRNWQNSCYFDVYFKNLLRPTISLDDSKVRGTKCWFSLIKFAQYIHFEVFKIPRKQFLEWFSSSKMLTIFFRGTLKYLTLINYSQTGLFTQSGGDWVLQINRGWGESAKNKSKAKKWHRNMKKGLDIEVSFHRLKFHQDVFLLNYNRKL